MFRALGVVPQGYYQWAKRNDDDDESDRILVAEIRDVMAESRQTYGVKRVTQALKERGFHVNHKRVERLMREHDIRCKKVKRFKKTTNSNHKFPASEDRLQRRFDVAEPNRVWVSDITYLKTREGWLYLCVWIDLYSRAIVGWSISTSLASSVVCEALDSALKRRPGVRPLVHSDRGIQYASSEFRRMLWRNKLRQSMGKKGDCFDNAVAESFFGILKTEIDLTKNLSAAQVRQTIFDYIEIFYNRKRLHSKLGYKTPEEVENKYGSLTDAS
jgi:putative transposase